MKKIINQVIIYKIFSKTDPYPSLSLNPEPLNPNKIGLTWFLFVQIQTLFP